MKTYHGERTEQGCEVTVDGEPLSVRSILSGNATTGFDWGYVGTGQLSLALLSNLLGNDLKATAMSGTFEREVVANLPHDRWTMSEYDFATALAPLVGADGARAYDAKESASSVVASGELLVESSTVLVPKTLKTEDATANASMVSEGGHLDVPMAASNEAMNDANRTADEAVGAANRALDTAVVAKATREAAHVGDTPADEAMSTTNRAVDHEAYSDDRATGKAVTVARKAVDEAKRCGEKT
jgi:hypothetical protein